MPIKISQMGDATAPLDGTEEVPLLQGGENKKVAASAIGGTGIGGISDLEAAAALTGTEEVPLVQAGSTVRTTAQAIADLGGGGGGGDLITLATFTGVNSLTNVAFQILLPDDLAVGDVIFMKLACKNNIGSPQDGSFAIVPLINDLPILQDTGFPTFALANTNTLNYVAEVLITIVGIDPVLSVRSSASLLGRQSGATTQIDFANDIGSGLEVGTPVGAVFGLGILQQTNDLNTTTGTAVLIKGTGT